VGLGKVLHTKGIEMFAEKTYTVKGIAPLLMHNGQMVNPLNPLVKEIKKISSKRKKTDDDHAELSRLEFQASLYVNSAGEYIIPAEMIEATLINGAKKRKLGTKFKSAVFVENDGKLDYEGPKEWEKRLKDPNCVNISKVRVQQNSVMRTRPQFNVWGTTFTVLYDPELVDASDLDNAVADAGRQCGFGDWRPRFGRFTVAA